MPKVLWSMHQSSRSHSPGTIHLCYIFTLIPEKGNAYYTARYIIALVIIMDHYLRSR